MSEQEHSDSSPSGQPNQRNLHSALSVAKTEDDCSHSSVSSREIVEDQMSGTEQTTREIAQSPKMTVDAQGRDEKLKQTLKKELKFHYNKLQRLQPMPWMKRVTVDLGRTFSSLRLVDSQSRRVLREKALGARLSTTVRRSVRSDVDTQQIFSPLEFDGNIVPKRILMEGEAGIGKTTFCRKLAYDWRNGEDYMKVFSAVFIIDIRKFKGSLKMAMREQGLVSKDMGLDILWEYIGRCADEFLWVIDGLDELYPDVKGEIGQIIKGVIFRNSTVLATSRMYEHSFLGTNEDTFHREIRNTGFLPKTSDEFMEKYFHSKPSTFDSSDLLAFVRKDRGKLRNLTRNPLICMYLCFLWEDKLSRDALMMSQYLDFCQVSIKMRECVSRRFYETSVKGKVPESVFEDRVQKARLLAFDGLMTGRQQYTFDDINRLFSVSLAEDDILFQMGLLSKEFGKVGEKTTTIFEFPHKVIQDELAGEYINLLTETDRESLFEEIINVPAHYQMLVFMSALARKDSVSKLMPMFTRFHDFVLKLPDYDSVQYNPFESATACLPLDCLAVSGCSQNYADKLCDAYQLRGVSDIWFSKSKLLASYEDTVKGLSCLVEKTSYKEFVTDLSVCDWKDTFLPDSIVNIINNLASLERVYFSNVPCKFMLKILQPNVLTINTINQVRISEGLEENDIESFAEITTLFQFSDIVYWDISSYEEGDFRVLLRLTTTKEAAASQQQKRAVVRRDIKTDPPKSVYAYRTMGNAKDACFHIMKTSSRALTKICKIFEDKNLQGHEARIAFEKFSDIHNAVDILQSLQILMSSVEISLPSNSNFVKERKELVSLLKSEVLKSRVGYSQVHLNLFQHTSSFIHDAVYIQKPGRCKWMVGDHTNKVRICELCELAH